MTARQRAITGGLWVAAAAAGLAGWRLHRAVYPAVLAVAAVGTAVTLSTELAQETGDRITDVILARLAVERALATPPATPVRPDGRQLEVVRLGA